MTPGLDVVLSVTRKFCDAVSQYLEDKVEDSMMDARQTIAQPRRGSDQPLNLQEVCQVLLSAITDNIRYPSC